MLHLLVAVKVTLLLNFFFKIKGSLKKRDRVLTSHTVHRGKKAATEDDEESNISKTIDFLVPRWFFKVPPASPYIMSGYSSEVGVFEGTTELNDVLITPYTMCWILLGLFFQFYRDRHGQPKKDTFQVIFGETKPNNVFLG